MNQLNIRPEKVDDHEAIHQLIIEAFSNEEYSDHKEQDIVCAIRQTDNYIPELALVAEYKGEIVGHVILSQVQLEGESVVSGLALAPVSVIPKYQGRGIGSQLIQEAHQRANNYGAPFIVLIGHAEYYPRFGYEVASKYGITFPFEIPDEYKMVYIFNSKNSHTLSGMIKYPDYFFH